MPADEKRRILRSIWRAKVHVEPRALELSPRAVRDAFAHIWAPTDVVMEELCPLSLGLLRLWHESERGHLIFTHQASRYRAGPVPWRDATLEGVCYISVQDVHRNRAGAVLPVLSLLDHLMGSASGEDATRLSGGSGISDSLRDVARRFVRIHRLGYGHQELGVTAAHDYFAHTLWLYLKDPGRLGTLDPLAYRLYRNTLMSESFWRAGGQ